VSSANTDSSTDNPETAVEKLMSYDFAGESRQNPDKYFQILDRFIAHEMIPTSSLYPECMPNKSCELKVGNKGFDVIGPTINAADIFTNCSLYTIIRNYRVIGGGYMKTEQAKSPKDYYVKVEVEVLLLPHLIKKIDERDRCEWENLEVMNMTTGKWETYPGPYGGENIVKLIHQIGTPSKNVPDQIVVDPNRRQWRFQVPLKHDPKGWVFARPFLPVHIGLDAELQKYKRMRENTYNRLLICAVEEKPKDNFSKDCAPEKIALREKLLLQYDAVLQLLQSFRIQ
jgi:hypothetical protein